jgi:hypothetical protein
MNPGAGHHRPAKRWSYGGEGATELARFGRAEVRAGDARIQDEDDA